MFDPQDSQDGSDKMKDIVFCSNNCFVLYSAALQAKNSENKVSIKMLVGPSEQIWGGGMLDFVLETS